MKIYGYLAGATLALAACGGGQEPPPVLTVSDVAVLTDLSAVTSQQAARQWGNLDSDIESAIATQFVGETGPGGVNVTVDIDELSLASFFETAAGADAARLTGDVVVTGATNERTLGVYTVSASANQALQAIGMDERVQTIPASNAEFYSAVVDAFARGVAEAVRGTPLPG